MNGLSSFLCCVNMTFAKSWANLDRNVPRLSKQRVRTECNRSNGEEYEETYAVNEHEEIFIVTSICCSRKDVIRHGDNGGLGLHKRLQIIPNIYISEVSVTCPSVMYVLFIPCLRTFISLSFPKHDDSDLIDHRSRHLETRRSGRNDVGWARRNGVRSIKCWRPRYSGIVQTTNSDFAADRF